MLAAPFQLVGGSALEAVRVVFERAALGWAADWGLDGDVNLKAVRAWELAAHEPDCPGAERWTQCAQHGLRGAWFRYSDDLCGTLEMEMFATSAEGKSRALPARLAPAAATFAREGLLDALARAALTSLQNPQRSERSDIPVNTWRRGSGAVVVLLDICGKGCSVLLDGQAVQALQLPPPSLPELPPLDIRAGLAAVPVALHVRVGRARVGLASLLSLAVGDVIRLDTLGDAPVSLWTSGNSPVFNAYLGRTGEHIAVELVNNNCDQTGAIP